MIQARAAASAGTHCPPRALGQLPPAIRCFCSSLRAPRSASASPVTPEVRAAGAARQGGRAVTAGTCLELEKGWTVTPQRVTATTQPASLDLSSLKLSPSPAPHSWRSLQRTVLLQQVTASWFPSSSERSPDPSCVLTSTQLPSSPQNGGNTQSLTPPAAQSMLTQDSLAIFCQSLSGGERDLSPGPSAGLLPRQPPHNSPISPSARPVCSPLLPEHGLRSPRAIEHPSTCCRSPGYPSSHTPKCPQRAHIMETPRAASSTLGRREINTDTAHGSVTQEAESRKRGGPCPGKSQRFQTVKNGGFMQGEWGG